MRRIVAAGLVVLAACASSQPEDDKDIISNRVGDWETSLSSTAGSSVRGSAKAQSVGVGTGVSISIEGAAVSAQHPWHLHTGTCGSGGGIVGSGYPLLSVSAGGTASANTSIGVALREDERYHVNVHRSTTDLTVIACGNLSND